MGCAESSNLEHSEDQQPNILTTSTSIIDASLLCENPGILLRPTPFLRNPNGMIFRGQLGYQKVAINKINPKNWKEMQIEIALFSQLDHENVIRYLFDLKVSDTQYVVTEFFEITLEKAYAQVLTDDQKNLIWQLVNAVEFLQSLKIVVLNLTPFNIYVVKKNSKLIVKLTDFSCAMKLQKDYGKTTKIIPKTFSAPEIDKSKCVKLSSDLYSLGCVIFYLNSNGKILNKIPFKQFGKIIEGKSSNASSRDFLCADLIRQLIKRKPIAKIMQHPFAWDDKQTISLIIDIAVVIESGDLNFRKWLYNNSHHVIGVDEKWRHKIDPAILKSLKTAEDKFRARHGKPKENEKKENIISLINTMRKILVHSQPADISACMGTPSMFIDYWSTKFPALIQNLYNAKRKFDNGDFRGKQA